MASTSAGTSVPRPHNTRSGASAPPVPSRSAKRNAEFIAEQEREEIQQRVLVLEEDLRQSLEKQETYQDDIAQLDASLRLKDQSIQELRLRMDGVRSSTDGNTLISRAGIEKVVRGLPRLRSELASSSGASWQPRWCGWRSSSRRSACSRTSLTDLLLPPGGQMLRSQHKTPPAEAAMREFAKDVFKVGVLVMPPALLLAVGARLLLG
ncbi:MAG: hypothetical protein WDW38_006428 [Sanguina aurantia]